MGGLVEKYSCAFVVCIVAEVEVHGGVGGEGVGYVGEEDMSGALVVLCTSSFHVGIVVIVVMVIFGSVGGAFVVALLSVAAVVGVAAARWGEYTSATVRV